MSLFSDLVIGKLGVGAQKNFMSRNFAEGEHVVHMDDDVESIVQVAPVPGKRNESEEIGDFRKQAAWAFKLCQKSGTRLWGIQMTTNAFFLSARATIGWLYGPVYGEVNSRGKRFRVARSDGNQDDVERTLQHIRAYGNIVRLSALGMKTIWRAPGGMQARQTVQERHAIGRSYARVLARRFPDIVKRVEIAELPHDVNFKFFVSPTCLIVPMPLL
jgi:hypothetical protein